MTAKPREFWIELSKYADTDGWVYVEPVDGLEDAIHVIEVSALRDLEREDR